MGLVYSSGFATFNATPSQELNCSILEENTHHTIVGHPTVHILLAVVLVSLTIFALTSNAIVLKAIVRWRLVHRSRRSAGIGFSPQDDSPTSVFLMGVMAFTDFFLGSITLPLSLIEFVQNYHWSSRLQVFKVRSCLNVFWCTLSMYNMTSLAIDRYIAVCWPFFYRTLPARNKFIIFGVFISLPLILTIFLSVSGFQMLTLEQIKHCGISSRPVQVSILFIANVSLTLYIPIVITSVLYFKVFRQISQLKKTAPYCGRSLKSVRKMTLNKVKNFQTISLKTIFYNGGSFHTSSDSSRIRNDSSPDTISSNTISRIENKVPTHNCAPNFIIFNAHKNSDYDDSSKQKEKTSTKEQDGGSCHSSNTNVRKNLSARLNAERTLAVLVASFIFCWLPLSLAATLSYILAKPLPAWIILAVTWLGYANAALSPILFCFHRDIWQAVKLSLYIN
ncbi:5-hydroxytryptamine receptor 1A-alpha [Biomphalaria glabrata]|nr:5-hydroxytryptamine receptor 1A-alpha [Biomphalaria glabrata]